MKRLFISIAFLTGITLFSCNDSFLDKSPVTDLTEENAFNSYDNFKAFMWPCYEMFTNNTIRTSLNSWGQNGQYKGDMDAGYMENKAESGYNQFAYQTVASVASGNGWDFKTFIRRINIMLSHIDASTMKDEEKDHWRAVGYFFHSYWYMELIDRFGDIPWVDQVLSEDSPEAYGKREDRKVVADKVLERLQWAEQNIGNFTSLDGKNTIDRNCVRAALSRFTLREGTWRKYHELGDYEKYLQECVRVSELLMDDYPTLYNGTDGQPAAGYGEIWTTEDLGSTPGVILYKSYVADINPHGACYIEHTSSHHVEMNQKTVDLYLMKNGKPILNSTSGYHGNKDMYAVFRDRDPRLYHTVIPPYKVKAGKGDYNTWSYTDEVADREYIDIMGANTSCSNPGIGMKRLPGQNWSASLVPEIPRLGTGAFVTCRSGYYVWKNWNNWETNFNNGNLNTSDKPIFKIEEILLNEAEAKFELGNFDQGIADKTINRLRERSEIAKMVVADINDSFDPNRGKYYPKNNDAGIQVNPVLWEIRRERIIELMGEGFGFYDVRRWRMAPWFLNQPASGIWATKEMAMANSMTLYNPLTGYSDGTGGSLAEGNIYLFNDPLKEGKGWLEKYYLYQVPTTEILLNPDLEQNPGW
ncbi:RagB/SusD family nutrient uptake outer membrane protein [uncultured Parabacteroides sp.]|uniref:RagB/SusD family nutrient uptake outer membrane protein n=1 Tax=uncultured Parabacteroides sp. TaxID=512312 RepID=UPI00258FA7EE|nr:RagB/SusD family nutrient uptake outer membrane protein [uncultured Parabacteroides sp.]